MEQAAVPSYVREQRLQEWIDLYANDIIRICFVYLADRDQAEDAMQDTFLKAWKSMPSYERKSIENDKAWLMRIAVNVCRDYRRSAWFRHVDRRVSLDSLPRALEAADGRDRDLTMDICRLPVKYRQVVLLYYFEGMNTREVSQALGLAPATAHRRLKKAEEMLKDAWGGGDEDER